ncbi:Huntingtinlike, partial [Caligus rogercresseyi]
WCLSCFFLSVPPPQIALPTDNASDYWLQALFPHLQTRLGCFTPEDRKLFCLVAKEFYSHLEENEQQEKFLSAFKEAAHPKTTPYCDLLQIIDIN